MSHTAYAHMLKQKSTKRAYVLLPEDLVREIDALAGWRGRTAFLVETAHHEVRRRKLLAFLDQDQPVWRSEDHPELAKGSGNWVRSLRKTSSRSRNSRSK